MPTPRVRRKLGGPSDAGVVAGGCLAVILGLVLYLAVVAAVVLVVGLVVRALFF